VLIIGEPVDVILEGVLVHGKILLHRALPLEDGLTPIFPEFISMIKFHLQNKAGFGFAR